MATETEAPPTDAKAPAPAGEVKADAKVANPWIPVAVVALLCPLLSFAVIQFLILPKMEKTLEEVATRIEVAQAGSGEESAHGAPHKAEKPAHAKEAKKEEKGGGHGEKKKEGEGGGGSSGTSHEFKGIIANISGALQSRYIKVSFTVSGDDPALAEEVVANQAKMVDATLGILSALTLNDLEQPGIKNIVRSDLLGAYEAILHTRLVKELYFSEFVIQ